MHAPQYEKIPYYRISFLQRWKRCDGDNGCIAIPDAAISMSKAPPPLSKRPKAEPAPKPLKPEQDGWDRMVDAAVRFKTWLNTPDPQKPAQKATAPRRKIPPFDIQQIPNAMRAERMPMGAKLMERWFAGELNYSPNDDAEKALINQDGKPYPESMFDLTDIKMGWVLGFARAKIQYDNLINTYLYSDRAREQLAAAILPYRHHLRLDLWRICNGDIRTLHRNFQFQRAPVGGTLEQKIDLFLQRLPHGGAPDDLTAALGSFNFYAAVVRVKNDRSQGRMTATHAVVYVKDNYTFSDKPDRQSQYLGHWNSRGVVVVPAFVASDMARLQWLDYPVLTGDMPEDLYRKDAIFYPVRNSAFRQWQLRHRQGGDYVIFSDYKPVRLDPPISIYYSPAW